VVVRQAAASSADEVGGLGVGEYVAADAMAGDWLHVVHLVRTLAGTLRRLRNETNRSFFP
jgi:hypothetical protein